MDVRRRSKIAAQACWRLQNAGVDSSPRPRGSSSGGSGFQKIPGTLSSKGARSDSGSLDRLSGSQITVNEGYEIVPS